MTRFLSGTNALAEKWGTSVVIDTSTPGARYAVGALSDPGGWVDRGGYWTPAEDTPPFLSYVSEDLPGAPMVITRNAFGMMSVHETQMHARMIDGWVVVDDDQVRGTPTGDVDGEAWELW